MARFLEGNPNGLKVQELEIMLRSAIFKPANAIIGFLLQQAADQADGAYQPKLGQVFQGRGTLWIDGMFGSLPIERDYYYHPGKKEGYYPADAALGLEGSCTPALARLMCLEGADESSYQKAERHLREIGGIDTSARQIQRLVQKVGAGAQEWQEREANSTGPQAPIMYVSGEGTGLPMRKEELEGVAGKQEDGSAKTAMMYGGCVFTQHKTDEEGNPVRDHESTTYVSSFESINEFGPMLRQEALRRGMALALQVVLLIDGAPALEKMGRTCFATAIQIVDFYHALEHTGKVLEALLGSKKHPGYQQRLELWKQELLKDKVKELIQQALAECAGKTNAPAVEKELGYFRNNIDRMQYGTFRAKGFFIGSGVMEAGCKTVIGARCKHSGMFWGREGAQNIVALRCVDASHRLDDFWKDRLNDHAARNDSLPLAA
jgi:hypothetical protein